MARKNESNSPATSEEFRPLLEQLPRFALALQASATREDAENAIFEIQKLPENTQLALVQALSSVSSERDAAVAVLEALYELSPSKNVHKEARRALIRLSVPKHSPRWDTTAPLVSAPAPPISQPPRFWKGKILRTREQGETVVVLAWEYGTDYSQARLMSFLLEYWQDGVKDFELLNGTRRQANEQYDAVISQTPGNFVDGTLAEARRLIEDALSVNEWRGTEPHEDFRRNRTLINQLILSNDEAGEDRGQTFIDPTMETDEVVGNFIGAWSLGDYALAYDLLATLSPLRDRKDRVEWIDLHRQWHDEARPTRMDLSFLREKEPQPAASPTSGLWLPTTAKTMKVEAQKTAEVGWSLELTDTPLNGALPEMPMGTAHNKQTGRSWFWTSYTLIRESEGLRIDRMTDEGAAAQSLSAEDLQKLQQASDQRVQEITSTQQPTRQNGLELMQEIISSMTKTLHYADALIVKRTNDREVHEDAFSRTLAVQNNERGLVYLEKMEQLFPGEGHAAILRQLALNYATQSQYYQERGLVYLEKMEQLFPGEGLAAILPPPALNHATHSQHYQERGLEDQAGHFLDLAEQAMRRSLDEEQSALAIIFVAEALIQKDNTRLDEAQALLEQARPLVSTSEEQGQIEMDLGAIAQHREQDEEAIEHYQRAARLYPKHPSIWHLLAGELEKQKRTDEALRALERGTAEHPDDVLAFTNLANLYAGQNKALEAAEVLERGIRFNPDSAHLRAMLSSNYLVRGDRRHAWALLEEAEHLNKDLEIVRVMRSILEEDKNKKK